MEQEDVWRLEANVRNTVNNNWLIRYQKALEDNAKFEQRYLAMLADIHQKRLTHDEPVWVDSAPVSSDEKGDKANHCSCKNQPTSHHQRSVRLQNGVVFVDLKKVFHILLRWVLKAVGIIFLGVLKVRWMKWIEELGIQD